MKDISQQTIDFVRLHRHDDVRTLALKYGSNKDIDIAFVLDQIAGWQTMSKKNPAWAATEGIVYPPKLSLEQCSSQETANYKADILSRLIRKKNGLHAYFTLADLTGGLGVDFACMASRTTGEGEGCVYVERNETLCDIARHNLPLLGLPKAQVVCDEAENYLAHMPATDVVYMDPARRNAQGGKTVAIADCTPNVAQLMPLLTEKAEHVLVKLSPMLDWHKAIEEIAHVKEVHIVEAAGECKELLLVMERCCTGKPRIVCAVNGTATAFDADTAAHPTNVLSRTPEAGQWLYEPSPAIMKAGVFGELCERHGVKAISRDSHLFVADEEKPDFPGRRFHIGFVSTMNKKELKQALKSTERANIAVRNFPLTADALRRRLHLKDGGNTYIFGTTTATGHHIIIGGEK